ncbi:hypothetical protein MESS4_640042 [Mesorhizobium sp. STM 4661]|nr:hypothetical protein MESS4_640042 [Mesorhizobium sp. STM 4661]
MLVHRSNEGEFRANTRRRINMCVGFGPEPRHRLPVLAGEAIVVDLSLGRMAGATLGGVGVDCLMGAGQAETRSAACV